MKIFSGLLLIICCITSFISCDKSFDTLEVVCFTPGNNETGILPESFVEVKFNSSVNKTDVEDNFSLKNSEGSINGNFTWSASDSFRYIPEIPMKKNGRYIIELPRSIRDNKGNTMESDFISEFYVGNDFTRPSISSTIPAYSTGALTNVPVDQNIIINFSKTMNRESVETNFSITPDVPGYFVWSESIPGLPDSRLVFTLLDNMEFGKLYSFTVSGSAADIAGNTFGSDYKVNFITGDDFTPPVVESMYDFTNPGAPLSTSTLNDGISRRVTVGITFSEAMDRQSVEKAFSTTPSIQGIFEWSSDRFVRFRPSSELEPETRYQISVETSAEDLNGLKLSSRYSIELLTDNPDSLYVKCGTISGSNHDGDFAPLTGSWPMIIDMGSGLPVNKSYYILIEFLANTSGQIPAQMNEYSIFDNIIIDSFKSTSTGTGLLPDPARIGEIEWSSSNTVKIKIDGMTNKSSGQAPFLYRLKIAGGESGIKDISGNYLKNDLIIEFREVMP
jgi:hypothetical protein